MAKVSSAPWITSRPHGRSEDPQQAPSGQEGCEPQQSEVRHRESSDPEVLDGNELSQMQLTDCVTKALEGRLEGAVQCYAEAVKLDLEA